MTPWNNQITFCGGPDDGINQFVYRLDQYILLYASHRGYRHYYERTDRMYQGRTVYEYRGYLPAEQTNGP